MQATKIWAGGPKRNVVENDLKCFIKCGTLWCEISGSISSTARTPGSMLRSVFYAGLGTRIQMPKWRWNRIQVAKARPYSSLNSHPDAEMTPEPHPSGQSVSLQLSEVASRCRHGAGTASRWPKRLPTVLERAPRCHEGGHRLTQRGLFD